MDKEKSNRIHIVMFILTISLISCAKKYEKHLADILYVSEVNVISTKSYESNALGEWYIVEKYVLGDNVVDKLAVKTHSTFTKMEKHPIIKDYYWTGWNSLSEHSSWHSIVLESASYLSNNSLVQEYEKCCNSDAGYFCIIIQDSLELYNDLFEKTVVVVTADTTTNTLFICNYHF